MKSAENLILIDGDCNLCNRLVQFLVKRDRALKFHFANLEATPFENLNSVVFIQNEQVYFKSEAILKILRTLGGGWKILAILGKIVPVSWRNRLYALVANKRIAWFGKNSFCELPADPKMKARFLRTKDLIFPPLESHFQSY